MMGNFHWILEQGGVVEKEVPKLHECCMSDEQILKLCSISIKVGEGCWWKEKKTNWTHDFYIKIIRLMTIIKK